MSLLFWSPGDALAAFTRGSTATYWDENGVLATAAVDEPRDDHWVDDGGTLVRTLLLEESRTNIHPHGRAVNSWSAGTAGVTANTHAGPDGTTVADTVTDSVTNGFPGKIHQMTGLSLSASAYTISLFIRKDSVTTRFPAMTAQFSTATSQTQGAQINTSTGAHAADPLGTPAARGVEDCGDYWRLWIVSNNPNASNTIASINVTPAKANTLGGSGVNNVQGSIVVDLAQWELGAFATMPIPTTGSAVTRSADAATLSGSWSSQEVTQYVKFFDYTTGAWDDAISVFTGTAPQALTLNRAYSAVKVAAGNQTIEYMRALAPSGGGTTTLDAESGAFAITGTAATLIYGASTTLNAESGAFVITGTAATFEYTRNVESGVVAITGTPADLSLHRVLSAAAGAVTMTGTAAVLRTGRVLGAASGSVAITGTAATLVYGTSTVLSADPGAFAITGTAAALRFNRVLTATAGAVAITGTAATLVYGSATVLSADPGSFAITGTPAGLWLGRVLAAGAGTFTITGTAATTRYMRRVAAAAGAFTITGTDAALVHSTAGVYTLPAQPGAFAVAGSAATLRTARRLAAASGTVAITGTAVALRRGWLLAADPGAVALSGTAASFLWHRALVADSGEFVIVGTDAVLRFTGRQTYYSLATLTGYRTGAATLTGYRTDAITIHGGVS
jgi:hypothetical protein